MRLIARTLKYVSTLDIVLNNWEFNVRGHTLLPACLICTKGAIEAHRTVLMNPVCLGSDSEQSRHQALCRRFRTCVVFRAQGCTWRWRWIGDTCMQCCSPLAFVVLSVGIVVEHLPAFGSMFDLEEARELLIHRVPLEWGAPRRRIVGIYPWVGVLG